MRFNVRLLLLLLLTFTTAISQESQEFLVDMAKQKLVSGEYLEVLYFINKAIENEPNNSQYYVMRSMAKANTSDLKGAFKDLDKALDVNPNYELAYYNKGVIYNDFLGKYKKAIKAYDQALEINPRYRDAQYNRAVCKMDLGDDAGCLADVEAILEYHPEDDACYKILAKYRMKANDIEGAIEYLEKALKFDPDDAQTYVLTGLMYLKIEDRNKACSYFHMAKHHGYESASDLISEHCKAE